MLAGSGTLPLMSVTIPGLVPQVTCGYTSSAVNLTVSSKVAPSSDGSCFQALTASSKASPLGAKSRFLMYSKVFSSGATIPARAPASMVMLQSVIRPSIERLRIASPENSMAYPVPPAVPIRPMIARMMSLAVTFSGRLPVTSTSIVFGLCCWRVCVARTCSTSEVPMPNANAPKAPWVAVWESPQTIVEPGSVNPCSGPIT